MSSYEKEEGISLLLRISDACASASARQKKKKARLIVSVAYTNPDSYIYRRGLSRRKSKKLRMRIQKCEVRLCGTLGDTQMKYSRVWIVASSVIE